MFACWQTYDYFNIVSNNVNKKMTKNELFLAAFFPIEIGNLSSIISLKNAEFLTLAGSADLGLGGVGGRWFVCRVAVFS